MFNEFIEPFVMIPFSLPIRIFLKLMLNIPLHNVQLNSISLITKYIYNIFGATSVEVVEAKYVLLQDFKEKDRSEGKPAKMSLWHH